MIANSTQQDENTKPKKTAVKVTWKIGGRGIEQGEMNTTGKKKKNTDNFTGRFSNHILVHWVALDG